MASITGTTSSDSLTGTGNADDITGLLGSDTISALGGTDLVYGNLGNDSILAAGGADTVFGGHIGARRRAARTPRRDRRRPGGAKVRRATTERARCTVNGSADCNGQVEARPTCNERAGGEKNIIWSVTSQLRGLTPQQTLPNGGAFLVGHRQLKGAAQQRTEMLLRFNEPL